MPEKQGHLIITKGTHRKLKKYAKKKGIKLYSLVDEIITEFLAKKGDINKEV